MPRYIDADRIVFWIRHVSSNGKLCDTDVRKVAFSDEIARIPTADVVPKSEVEKAIDDLKRYIILNEDISKKCKMENGEQNEEYWKGKLSAFLQIRGYLDTELKKKYQKGEPNGSKN